VKSRKTKRSAQSLWLLFARTTEGAVWLQQRPSKGVWASLYTFPIFETESALLANLPQALHSQLHFAPAFVHVLTHKDLHLHVARLTLPKKRGLCEPGRWWDAKEWQSLGLPAPVRQLLMA
jgi:A/G-specific adenine glycosylase